MRAIWKKASALLSGCSSGGGSGTPDGGQAEEQPLTFHGSDLGIKSDMALTFPFLGLSLNLPESLERRMDGGEVLCRTGESMGGAHTILETSGGCLYVLSLREGGDAAVAEELRLAAEDMTVTEMVPFSGGSSFEEPRAEISSLGEFTTQTITGETVTQKIFRGRKLTMINLSATWCTPCVQEIPALERLSQTMADKGVQVIGVVLDTVDDNGEVNEEAVEKAKVLRERTGATYPFIMPDETNLNDRLAGIAAVPETFFVDENGSIVGETRMGAGALEDWTAAVEAELAALEGAA